MDTNAATVMEMLRKLGEDAEHLTGGTLNNGGCCVFAALVGEHLTKLGIDVHGVVANWNRNVSIDERRPPEPRNYDIHEWNHTGIFFDHILLELRFPDQLETFYYDSESLNVASPSATYYGRGVAPGNLSLDELQALAASENGWNCMFDRDMIPELRELIAESFQELACEPA